MRPFTANLALEDVLPLLPARHHGEYARFKSYPPEDTAFETLVADLFARASELTGVPITNAVLDFRELLLGGSPAYGDVTHSYADGDHHGGWVTPDLYRVGSVARESARSELRDGFSCVVRRYFRGVTFFSLDAPTLTSLDEPEKPTFWRRVINPLLALPPERNTFDRWFEAFFRHCARKPVAVFSAEPPSNLLQQVAAASGVQLVHIPLHIVACEAVVAHHTFHLIEVSRNQWEALIAILRAAEEPTSTTGSAGARENSGGSPRRTAQTRPGPCDDPYEDTVERDSRESPKVRRADAPDSAAVYRGKRYVPARPFKGKDYQQSLHILLELNEIESVLTEADIKRLIDDGSLVPEEEATGWDDVEIGVPKNPPPSPRREAKSAGRKYTQEEKDEIERDLLASPIFRRADASEFNPLTIVGVGKGSKEVDPQPAAPVTPSSSRKAGADSRRPDLTEEERDAIEARRRANPKIRYPDASEFNPLTIVGVGPGTVPRTRSKNKKH